MTTRDEAVEKMTRFANSQPTLLLCTSLETLDAKSGPDEAERLARSVLIDVLCERHPEADAAFTAWADSDDYHTGNAVKAITGAAREAARA